MFLLSSKIPQFRPMNAKIHQLEKTNHMKVFSRRGGGLEGSRNDVSFKSYQANDDENDKGREGGPKFRKMGRRHSWMAPNMRCIPVQVTLMLIICVGKPITVTYLGSV